MQRRVRGPDKPTHTSAFDCGSDLVADGRADRRTYRSANEQSDLETNQDAVDQAESCAERQSDGFPTFFAHQVPFLVADLFLQQICQVVSFALADSQPDAASN